MPSLLSSDQVETFQRDGVLVVDNFLSIGDIQEAFMGIEHTLGEYGVDVHDLENTGHMLRHLSSTNGSGGILDLFYPSFKMKIATDERLFQMTSELWRAAYFHQGESLDDARSDTHIHDYYKYHPFGSFDHTKGYCYIDRIGYRLPTTLAEQIAMSNAAATNKSSNKQKKKRKNMAIQRSLTPHLDCCPDTFFTTMNKDKWRPIQCFVSLTDNTEPSTGGFEAHPGFHHEFDEWSQQRPPTTYKGKDGVSVEVTPPCIGEYTHIRPKEDHHVMTKVKHIPVRAGSVVFWDNRIPHANAYRNNAEYPRVVIYCSFLPDVELNQAYVQNQLQDWYHRRIPRDMWINVEDGNRIERICDENIDTKDEKPCSREAILSTIGRKLMGIDPW